MVLDCHIHIQDIVDSPAEFQKKLKQAGVDGGILLSKAPASFDNQKPTGDSGFRLKQVLDYTGQIPGLAPFYFIDPMEPDAEEQVLQAAEAGIAGFKAICCHHYPQDDRAMRIWSKIAETGKPLLLHSGILYNAGPSAAFNRPGNFEDLLFIPGLRFALAHVSWPWCDELIAVYGKWNYFAYESSEKITSEMYVDLTPGTPPSYRYDVLSRLLQVGYPSLLDHMLFGTDGSACYDVSHIRDIIANDRGIYRELALSQPSQEKVFAQNLLRFLNPSEKASAVPLGENN